MPYNIRGGNSLNGSVHIQGSKNGALPILAASLLVSGKTMIHNCPRITDVDAMLTLLSSVGCTFLWEKNTLCIDAKDVYDKGCPKEQVKAMRSSVMLLGPLLARCGHVKMDMPGGCVIGKRPIDLHIMALGRMNATFALTEGQIEAKTDGLLGNLIELPFPSVGATETVLLASVLAEGTTVLTNAATEPEIVELCGFLIQCGAKISGLGTRTIRIEGLGKKEGLRECEYTVMPDRIVAGTYLFAAVATRGKIRVLNVPIKQLDTVFDVLGRMGCVMEWSKNALTLDARNAKNAIPYVRTQVYPGFPTDLQSMLTVCLAVAEGNSKLEETIFENRFRIIKELRRMGAHIKEDKNCIFIQGRKTLFPASVEAAELRGGAALVLAALAATGESVVSGTQYIERGYEDLVRDLRALGAQIQKG